VFLPVGIVRAQETTDTLLMAGVSNLSIAQGTSNSTTVENLGASSNISGDALVPSVTNISGLDGVDDGEALSDQIEIYVIRKGDSIGQIAEMFGVSVNTILLSNDMKKGDKLVEGDTLLILPIDGVSHTVVKGDTLKKIAAKYKVDVLDVAGYNGMSLEDQLTVGQELIIPSDNIDAPSTSTTKKISTGGKLPSSNSSSTKSIPGYFINPVPSGHKTQGLHDHNRAIDIGAPTGTPIRAAASGKVIFAKLGWNGGFGNLVIISHPNGTQTYYAHQSRLGVSYGEQVSQGQTIGYVGSTGHSTGPHIHFEVRGAKNPGADWSWKR
jgi:LysM repeat protein